MNLTTEQSALLQEAEEWIKSFVKESGGFCMFALAKQLDGKTNVIQPTDEFSDEKGALVETLRVLRTLAREGQIVANVICTPMSQGKSRAAVLDLECKTTGRLLVFSSVREAFFRRVDLWRKAVQSGYAAAFRPLTGACSGPESACLSSTTCRWHSYLPAAEAQR